MGRNYDFIMIFQDDNIGQEKNFLEILKKWAEKIRIGKDTVYGREVDLRTNDIVPVGNGGNKKYVYLPFYLITGPLH